MMGIWSSVAGLYKVQLTSASPSEILSAINEKGIQLMNVTYLDELCVQFQIYRLDLKSVEKITEQRGGQCKILKQQGVFWTVCRFIHRPVLVIGVITLFALSVYLPSRILFVEVEGNKNVSSTLILDKAELCGISFGVSRKSVRSEMIKNALLESIPELQWAGVNTVGCTAIITVQERSELVTNPQYSGVSSVVASRDGIIHELTVIKGTPLCNTGQAVRKGQVLVSGYTDLGLKIQAVSAEAEVFAQTMWNLDVITPAFADGKGIQQGSAYRYSLRIGKNIIKFYKDSGISCALCVKMKKEYPLELPGGFVLPVCLVVEKVGSYEHTNLVQVENSPDKWIHSLAEAYLCDQMISGKILMKDTSGLVSGDLFRYHGTYVCLEMIGRIRNEEIIQGNGKGK